jgi:DNA-binding NtrC family response regulator
MEDAGTVHHTAQVLLISDDESAGRHYRGALEAAGYNVTQTENFVDTLGSSVADPDVIVLCQLAALAYPGQLAPVIRIPEKMTPDDLVTEVHRKISMRATLLAAGG